MDTNTGYINNARPEWVKEYNRISRKFGKNQANMMYPHIKNWKASQQIQGLSPNTSPKASKSKRKARVRKMQMRKTRRSTN